ncbi:MAG: DNA polymerase III subunit delta [Calditrichota bacterium]
MKSAPSKKEEEKFTKFSAFTKDVEEGIFAPVYLFLGKEEFLIETGIQKIVDRLLDPADRTLNLYNCRGDEADELMDTLASPPLLAQKRVTIIRNADRLADKKLQAVLKFMKSPPSDGVLILTITEPDKRLSTYKSLTELTKPIACNRLYAEDLTVWIAHYTKGLGKRLDSEAMAQLASVNWPSLREAASDIDRLVLWAGDAEVITAQDISEMGGGIFALEGWRLTDAVISGNLAAAMKTLVNMSYFGLKPTYILGDLYRMMQKLWVIKEFILRNKLNQAQGLVRLPPFVFEKYTNYAPKIPQNVLEDGILRVFEAEINIKRGLRDGEQEIILIVGELARAMKGK